jgi:hypothetical protein
MRVEGIKAGIGAGVVAVGEFVRLPCEAAGADAEVGKPPVD